MRVTKRPVVLWAVPEITSLVVSWLGGIARVIVLMEEVADELAVTPSTSPVAMSVC